MKCGYCGAELTESQKFCIFCGTKLEEQSETCGVSQAAFEEPEYEKPQVDWDAEMEFPEVPVPVPVASGAAQPEPGLLSEPAQSASDPGAPLLQLPTGRGLGKMFFLGILTLGIYPTVIWSRIVTELNLAASRYDGKRTMPYFAMCALAPVTLGIYLLVWLHNFCCRVGDELKRRGMDYKFGARTFWLWNVLGSLIIVGPFVFVHKLMKAMNMINADFNLRG